LQYLGIASEAVKNLDVSAYRLAKMASVEDAGALPGSLPKDPLEGHAGEEVADNSDSSNDHDEEFVDDEQPVLPAKKKEQEGLRLRGKACSRSFTYHIYKPTTHWLLTEGRVLRKRNPVGRLEKETAPVGPRWTQREAEVLQFRDESKHAFFTFEAGPTVVKDQHCLFLESVTIRPIPGKPLPERPKEHEVWKIAEEGITIRPTDWIFMYASSTRAFRVKAITVRRCGNAKIKKIMLRYNVVTGAAAVLPQDLQETVKSLPHPASATGSAVRGASLNADGTIAVEKIVLHSSLGRDPNYDYIKYAKSAAEDPREDEVEDEIVSPAVLDATRLVKKQKDRGGHYSLRSLKGSSEIVPYQPQTQENSASSILVANTMRTLADFKEIVQTQGTSISILANSLSESQRANAALTDKFAMLAERTMAFVADTQVAQTREREFHATEIMRLTDRVDSAQQRGMENVMSLSKAMLGKPTA